MIILLPLHRLGMRRLVCAFAVCKPEDRFCHDEAHFIWASSTENLSAGSLKSLPSTYNNKDAYPCHASHCEIKSQKKSNRMALVIPIRFSNLIEFSDRPKAHVIKK